MIARMIETLLLRRLKSNPAAVLVGPRQSGKTTLARSLSSSYFDLEQPADRLRLDPQWSGLVAGHRLMILDEAQTWPELFPRLRAAIDADRRRSALPCGAGRSAIFERHLRCAFTVPSSGFVGAGVLARRILGVLCSKTDI